MPGRPSWSGGRSRKRSGEIPDGLERVPAGPHDPWVVGDLEGGVRAIARVVQEEHECIVEDVEVPTTRERDGGQARPADVADVLAGVEEQLDVALVS